MTEYTKVEAENPELEEAVRQVQERYGGLPLVIKVPAAEEDAYKLIRGEKVEGLNADQKYLMRALLEEGGPLSMELLTSVWNDGKKSLMDTRDQHEKTRIASTMETYIQNISGARGRVSQAACIAQLQERKV